MLKISLSIVNDTEQRSSIFFLSWNYSSYSSIPPFIFIPFFFFMFLTLDQPWKGWSFMDFVFCPKAKLKISFRQLLIFSKSWILNGRPKRYLLILGFLQMLRIKIVHIYIISKYILGKSIRKYLRSYFLRNFIFPEIIHFFDQKRPMDH